MGKLMEEGRWGALKCSARLLRPFQHRRYAPVSVGHHCPIRAPEDLLLVDPGIGLHCSAGKNLGTQPHKVMVV
jgi:hypothetical protein